MNKLFKNNAYLVLELFINNPNTDFHIRKVARMLKLTHPTVSRHISKLSKLGFLKKKDDSIYPTYHADVESDQYKLYKRNYIVEKIIDSGLVEYIQKKTLASSIILFGSCAKGTYTQKSDIDIFVEAEDNKLDISKFEKSLGRSINLLYESRIKDLSTELQNNIINGIVLYGFIRMGGK